MAAWWALVFLGVLWRRTVWQGASDALREASRVLDAPVRATWLGYQVRATDGRFVRYVGGLLGARTVWRLSGVRQRSAGWRALKDLSKP